MNHSNAGMADSFFVLVFFTRRINRLSGMQGYTSCPDQRAHKVMAKKSDHRAALLTHKWCIFVSWVSTTSFLSSYRYEWGALTDW